MKKVLFACLMMLWLSAWGTTVNYQYSYTSGSTTIYGPVSSSDEAACLDYPGALLSGLFFTYPNVFLQSYITTGTCKTLGYSSVPANNCLPPTKTSTGTVCATAPLTQNTSNFYAYSNVTTMGAVGTVGDVVSFESPGTGFIVDVEPGADTTISGITVKDSSNNSMGTAVASGNGLGWFLSTSSATKGNTYKVTVSGSADAGRMGSYTITIPGLTAYGAQASPPSWTAWTPTPAFGGNSTGMTFTSQSGQYSVDSNGLVHVQGYFSLSSKGTSTGAATLNIPTTMNTALFTQCSTLEFGGMSHTGSSNIIVQVYNSQIQLLGVNSSGAENATITNSDVNNNAWASFTCTYYQ